MLVTALLPCSRYLTLIPTSTNCPTLTPHPPQRLRDAIDSRIAEEQARSKTAQDSISRSNSARRPPGRALSPSKRPSRPRRNTSGTPVRGPDPTEFEPEFAIGDDDSSRSGTPRVDSPAPSEGQPSNDAEKSTEESAKESVPEPQAQVNQAPSELPPEIRVKLRRLDKMESRYHGRLVDLFSGGC